MQSIKTLLQQALRWLQSDGRHFQIVSQVVFLSFGLLVLGWDTDKKNIIATFLGVLMIQSAAILVKAAPLHSIKSALITGLGLSLLLKTNDPAICILAGTIAIGQKFLIRINGKHLWNPADFGIVFVILATGQAWISPGQWGSSAIIVFIVGTAGLAVLAKVRRLDTGIAFLLTLAALEFSRTIVYQGWEMEVLLHKLSSGSLWLFSLFMITDPMTSPNAPKARILWAMTIATASFILTNFYFVNGAPIWALFFLSPLSPLLDYHVKGRLFQWHSSTQPITSSK